MAKVTPIQPTFSGGEFSPLMYGRVDVERYKTGLATCLNYIPTVQGPVIRRPGTKFAAAVKDASKPPALIPFSVGQLNNYMLEFGQNYLRFYSNNAQITTNTTVWQMRYFHNAYGSGFPLYAARNTYFPNNGTETENGSTILAAGSILELTTPYAHPDVHAIKYAQKENALYLFHSSYPIYKLTYADSLTWDLSRVVTLDGPYLDLNSYTSTGDLAKFGIDVDPLPVVGPPAGRRGYKKYNIESSPRIEISGVTNFGGLVLITTAVTHPYEPGDRIVIRGVVGSIGAQVNNGTASIQSMYWTVDTVGNTSFILKGQPYGSGVYVSGGTVNPAMFEPIAAPNIFRDQGRPLGVVNAGAGRTWGKLTTITSMCQAVWAVDAENGAWAAPNGSSSMYFYFGAWDNKKGYPRAGTFHQDRLAAVGTPGLPQRIDLSEVGVYERFAPSNSSSVVTDKSAINFDLNSDQLNILCWTKSTDQGLLAGSISCEWKMAPSTQNGAMTPTNFNADQTSYFGSADIDAVQAGNATIYVQRSNRKVRELNYFFQIGTFRSTDLTEVAEHISNPSVTRLAVQRETQPIIWGLRSDGVLAAMTYNRDDMTLKAGWARHILGGQSDTGGSAPIVKSLAIMPDPTGGFDQLWVVVSRYIAGVGNACYIEYMTKPYEDATRQDDAFQGDCGASYDLPITITGISVGGSAIVTAASHGLVDGDSVHMEAVIGLNSSIVDVNGVTFNSSLVNERVFRVGSASTNAFFIQDINNGSSYIDSRSYSAYSSGGKARKLVSQITGLTWLKSETVGVLTDGGAHPATTVNSAGVLALQWPAAKVQIGYTFNSDAQLLRAEAGASDGSSIGKTRRPTRAAFMLHNVGDFSFGTDFNRLLPVNFQQADSYLADSGQGLWSGIWRDGLEAAYDFEGQVCFRQNSMLPGMVQAVTIMMEEYDV